MAVLKPSMFALSVARPPVCNRKLSDGFLPIGLCSASLILMRLIRRKIIYIGSIKCISATGRNIPSYIVDPIFHFV